MALLLVTVMALTLIVGALWESSQPGWEENTMERARFQAGLYRWRSRHRPPDSDLDA